MNNLNRKSITELARELRKNQTPSEKKLWEQLRYRRLNEFKFLRQKPIIHKKHQNKTYFYIADFYCAQKKLIIELDGKIHQKQKGYDNQRDIIMRNLGLRVLRIRNEELNDMDSVLRKIESCLDG